jgi:hypothetical protein
MSWKRAPCENSPTDHGWHKHVGQHIPGNLNYLVGHFAALTGGLAGVAGYSDLGSGLRYGAHWVSDADEGTVVSIALNAAARASLSAAAGSDWAIGGALKLDIPETTTFILLGAGLVSRGLIRRRWK